MDRTIETSGKTIEEAINAALITLGVDRDSVSVEVLEKPKPGFLGLGGSPARVSVTYSVSKLDRAIAFLQDLLEHMDVSAIVEGQQAADGNISLNISGENMGLLIGRRGDTLEALQHLVSNVTNRDEPETVRVTVDTEGYRAKREAALVQLAQKTAAKAVKYKRNIALEPMNAYARHVIHVTLQDDPAVTTHSTGVEPNRRVVIAVPGGDRPAPGAKRPFSGPRPPNRSGGGRRP